MKTLKTIIAVAIVALSLTSCKKEEIKPNLPQENIGSVVSKEILNETTYKISIKNDKTGNVFDYLLSRGTNGNSYITPTYTFSGVQTGFYDANDNYQDINSTVDYQGTYFPQNSGAFQLVGGGSVTVTFNIINDGHRSAVDPNNGIVGYVSNEELYNSLSIGDKQSVYKIPYVCNGGDNTVNNFCSEPYLW